VASSLSRGLSKGLVVKGAFRNALLPVITTLALSFAHLVGGSIVIESIFNWPGLGNYAMNSILVHNYPAIQGYTLLTVTTVIFINLTVEVAYILADPRVRKRHGKIVPKFENGEGRRA
jgi:ABC-type dipeptide/oligopeptide/nickel transport system permease component